MNKYAVLAVGVAAGLVVAPIAVAANAEFNPAQVCLDGSVDARFALVDYRHSENLQDRAAARIQTSADKHNGWPTKDATSDWRRLNRKADRLISDIRVNAINDDLEWCSSG